MAEQVVVYTTIFDDYDTLRAPVVRDRSVRWVCITDRVPANTRGWEIRLIDTQGVPHPFRPRAHKILSHIAFPEAATTVYIDGHIQLKVGPRDLIDRYLADSDLALFRHPKRDGVYDELEACARLGKDDPHLLAEIGARYRALGVPERGFLHSAGVILRHNSPVISKFNEAWMDELRRSGVRDQPALCYALWKTGLVPSTIDENIWDNPLVQHHAHKKRLLNRSKRYLFICGNPRSGTTALGDLLNTDSRLIIGKERYRRVRKGLGPEHFTKERFFEPTPQETSFLPARLIPQGEKGYSVWPDDEQAVRRKWNSPDLVYVGDKAPFYVRQLPYLRDSFPGCKLVVLLRDPVSVADSYQRRAEDPDDHWPIENDHTVAIEHWNQSTEDLNDHLDRFGLQDLFIVDYETFYSGDRTYLESLYRFLELEISPAVEERFIEETKDSGQRSERPLRLSLEEVMTVRDRADWVGYQRLEQLVPLMRDYQVLAAAQDGHSALQRRVVALEAAHRQLFTLSRALYAEGVPGDDPGGWDARWSSFWRVPELEPVEDDE